MDKQKLLPFRWGTRKRMRFVGSVDYSSGAELNPVRFPQTGMAAAIILEVSGTMNVSGSPGVLVDKGAWNLLKRIKWEINQATSTIIDLTGFGAFLVGSKLARGFRPDSSPSTPSSLTYAAPVANGNNTWKLMYYLPISVNMGGEFESGLINLQAGDVEANLNITCGANADVFASGAGTGFTGTIKVYYVYFDVASPAQFKWPPRQVCRTIEAAQPILVTGDYTTYQIPRQGRLLDLTEVVRCNGSLSNAVDKFLLLINKNDSVEEVDASVMAYLQGMNHTNVFPTGVFNWGYLNAMGEPMAGDMRDTLDTTSVTTIEFQTLITSGTTLGTNNNDCSFIRRVLVNL